MSHVRGDEHQLPFAHDAGDPLPGRVDEVDPDVALDLVEELRPRIDMEVVAGVRAAHHHHDELVVGDHHLVRDRRPKLVGVVIDPAQEMDGDRRGRHGGSSR